MHTKCSISTRFSFWTEKRIRGDASEICYDCGFNNKSNFIRIFRKKKGMTPIEYRKFISQMLIKY